jgi:hypothetical protein
MRQQVFGFPPSDVERGFPVQDVQVRDVSLLDLDQVQVKMLMTLGPSQMTDRDTLGGRTRSADPEREIGIIQHAG